ncbi:MAG: hypothetical protein FJZ64_00690 [Chlamydiae bacterium]|nr:hypothetical protein [Chlamydiota bacterium]
MSLQEVSPPFRVIRDSLGRKERRDFSAASLSKSSWIAIKYDLHKWSGAAEERCFLNAPRFWYFMYE